MRLSDYIHKFLRQTKRGGTGQGLLRKIENNFECNESNLENSNIILEHSLLISRNFLILYRSIATGSVTTDIQNNCEAGNNNYFTNQESFFYEDQWISLPYLGKSDPNVTELLG